MKCLRNIIASLTNGALYDNDKQGPSRVLVEPELTLMPEKPTVADAVSMEIIGVVEDINTVFPYLFDAVEITGQFEGQGFGQVTGDFDKQGMSFGILQWNIGQGSMQRVILQAYRKRYGKIANLGIFPDGQMVDAIAETSIENGLRMVRVGMLNGTKVRSEWKKAWQQFLTTPQVMNLQIEGAYGVAAKAQTLCNAWMMKSQRAFCFFFDIVTQNGSMKDVRKYWPSKREALLLVGKAKTENRKLWTPLIERATPEQLVLLQAAYDRALKANPTYFHDVYSRKGTIALGRGFVHGRHWDLFPTGT